MAFSCTPRALASFSCPKEIEVGCAKERVGLAFAPGARQFKGSPVNQKEITLNELNMINIRFNQNSWCAWMEAKLFGP